jgi:flavorubredoxin/flavin reductase (DIM6/NTAB) family NADH-FMN oxidoreductase RutF/rubredoxin
MYKKRLVVQDTYYVGASDRRLQLFENVYPLENGMSYNSYLIMDEKTCLMDTVDKSVEDIFVKKVSEVLENRKLDYLVINHMEPDHSYTAMTILRLHPEVTLVIDAKALTMFKNYNDGFEPKNLLVVKEGDTLCIGKHTLAFVETPMVHWPEVMMTYDTLSKTLFSADAFGTFAALNGNLFAHEVNFHHDYLDESRRYYTNIIGKYGDQVQAALKKAATLDIHNLCPLHGPIWRQDLSYILNLYDKWSRYEPEVKGVLVVYGSVYGHSEQVANMICDGLALEGVKNIKMYDASKTDKSYLVSETFKYSHLVVCSSTYNMGIFTPVEEYLLDLKYHNMQGKKVAIVENGSWAPNSGKLIRNIVESMKNMNILNSSFTITSAIKESQTSNIDAMVKEISDDFPRQRLDGNVMFNISYGLYVLTTNDGKKNNGCVVNTVMEVANSPERMLVSMNKMNYSTETVLKTKVMNLSLLNVHTPFALIKQFGFCSGRDTDKFAGFNDFAISSNGLPYLTRFTNGFISLKVLEVIDLGSHLGFICEITDKGQLSFEASLTYTYYQDNIKPRPARNEKKKVGWICKICGYIYEGEVLPKDFICPICKHPASDFEKLK